MKVNDIISSVKLVYDSLEIGLFMRELMKKMNW